MSFPHEMTLVVSAFPGLEKHFAPVVILPP